MKKGSNMLGISNEDDDSQETEKKLDPNAEKWPKNEFNLNRLQQMFSDDFSKYKRLKYFDHKMSPSLFKHKERNVTNEHSLVVSKKVKLNHDTYQFELKFKHNDLIAGHWPGAYYKFKAQVNGSLVTRKYCPVSPVN